MIARVGCLLSLLLAATASAIEIDGEGSSSAFRGIGRAGSGFVAVHLDDGAKLSAERLDTSGVVIGTTTVSESASDTAMATSGSTHLVVWITADKRQVRATRISSSGVVLDPGGTLIFEEPGFDSYGDPATIVAYAVNGAAAPGGWLVTWIDTMAEGGSAKAMFLDARADPAGPVRSFSNNCGRSRLATNGSNVMVITPSGDGGPIVRLLSPATGSTPSVWTSLPDSRARYLESETGVGAITSDGRDYYVVYEAGDSHAADQGIWIAKFDGTTLDLLGRRRISAGPLARSWITFEAGRFLVVWDEGHEIRASRMSTDLEFMDRAAGVKIAGDGARFHAVGDAGNSALVIFSREGVIRSRPVRF